MITTCVNPHEGLKSVGEHIQVRMAQSSPKKDGNNEQCMHANSINENIQPRTQGCEECEGEGKPWVALRLCVACGHVGCCDSSVGLHGAKHYMETGHPIITALPNKSWK